MCAGLSREAEQQSLKIAALGMGEVRRVILAGAHDVKQASGFSGITDSTKDNLLKKRFVNVV